MTSFADQPIEERIAQMNEGVEIAPDVAYGLQSRIEEQVTNGVAIRMALLYLIRTGRRTGRM